jgi:nitrogen regulatory protein P-II 1
MKKIEATFTYDKLDEICESLQSEGIDEVIVTELKLNDFYKGTLSNYSGTQFNAVYTPGVKIEIVCSNEMLKDTIMKFIKIAKAGHTGEGKIYVTSVGEIIDINSEESIVNIF